jgi:hypothetical protein
VGVLPSFLASYHTPIQIIPQVAVPQEASFSRLVHLRLLTMAILSVTLDTLSPALTEALEPFCTKYGFPLLARHFPLALASLAFWVSLQFASALITPSLYAPYKNLPRKTRVQWHVHLVALVHAVIITPLAAAQWYAVRQDGGLEGGKHPLAANRLYGYTVEIGNVYAIALGYFAWDVVVSALFDGPAFIAHGVVAMVAFTFVYVSRAKEVALPDSSRPSSHL